MSIETSCYIDFGTSNKRDLIFAMKICHYPIRSSASGSLICEVIGSELLDLEISKAVYNAIFYHCLDPLSLPLLSCHKMSTLSLLPKDGKLLQPTLLEYFRTFSKHLKRCIIIES